MLKRIENLREIGQVALKAGRVALMGMVAGAGINGGIVRSSSGGETQVSKAGQSITDTLQKVLEPQTAYAEMLKPPVYPSSDGRNTAIISFNQAGESIFVTSNSGLEIFTNTAQGYDTPGGLRYGGNVTVGIVASHPGSIGIRVLEGCEGGPYFDLPGNVGGTEYNSYAANLMKPLKGKMDEMSWQERRDFSMIGLITMEDGNHNEASPDLIGGSQDLGLRPEPKGCKVVPERTPLAPIPTVLPVPAAVTVAQPGTLAPIEACSVGDMQIADLDRKGIFSISGVPNRLNSGAGVDSANHGIFRPVPGMEGLAHVAGEPGSVLIDRNRIMQTEPQNLASWDAKVASGLAEYIRRFGEGPNTNFYDINSNTDAGMSLNPTTGLYEFSVVLPPHVIVRIDAEEADVYMSSANGDRNLHVSACQPGPAGNSGHETIIIRSPFGQGSILRIVNPTRPGTQVQIFGLQVQSPPAFVSGEAVLQGVLERQNRPGYGKVFVLGIDINSQAVGAVESPSLGAPFQVIGNNWK